MVIKTLFQVISPLIYSRAIESFGKFYHRNGSFFRLRKIRNVIAKYFFYTCRKMSLTAVF